MSGAMFIAVLGVAVVLLAFFVGADVALAACNRPRLRVRAEGGSRAAASAERLIGSPSTTTATVLIGGTGATLAAVLATGTFLADHGWSPMWTLPMLMPGLLLLGQLLPRAVVGANPDRAAPLVAPPLRLASWLLRPLVWVVGGFAGAVTRMAGTERQKAQVSRDELSRLLEVEPPTDKPQISADEREMIANVFELSGLAVRDLMVPLSEVTALPEDASMAEAALEVADKQHSRLPIYRARVDDIVGIVHVFDVLGAAGEPGKVVADVVRPATYVPETMKAIDLLVELQAEGQHLAIVVDEYGGAVGIVTTEDLLETIVGDIDDEYDHEPSPIRVERPGVWRIEARTPVARLNQELALDLPESDDYETLAGLLIERLRHIPESGTTVQVGAVTLEVVAATDRAIDTVRVSRRRK
jgi:putative hemolysin